MAIGIGFLLALLLLGSLPAGATEYTVLPGLTVIGWHRLTSTDQSTLRTLLSRVPRGIYPGLQTLHIDGEGVDTQDLHEINCFSGSALYEVCAHELGHQIDVTSSAYRHAWVHALIAEAGREPTHYLRSMFPTGFFADNPQEFLASMIGEWFLDSQPMLARALDAWQAGNPYPLDQAVLLMATFGLWQNGGDREGASVLAYRERIPELWWVTPWRCGGLATISGPMVAIMLNLDTNCRVAAVLERVGL